MLLVTRAAHDPRLLTRLDRCTLCGQLVWYLDEEINGSMFAEPVHGQLD